MNPLLLVDSYKIFHKGMYPNGMTKLYSNLTARKSRMKGTDAVVFFGLQHFCLQYLIEKFNNDFFIFLKEDRDKATQEELNQISFIYKSHIIDEYKRHCPVDTAHIEALWDLGYLPIEIKALPEGTRCPIGVPCLTITNTHPDFGWLVNYLETLISCMIWQPITSATIADQYKQLLDKYALKTTGTTEGVQWQGHDFSMRGMSSPESAVLSAMGHLLSFTGTDTVPAIYQLEESYQATGLIGASVPATEHSVMCMGQKESEVETFKRLLDLFPTGILSVVSDTWDLWKVLTEYLPIIKEHILSRDGKLVIRPDSGDPVDIICGQSIYDFSNDKYCPKNDLEVAKDYMKEQIVERVREETEHGEQGEYQPSQVFKYEGKYYKVTLTIDWNRHDKQYYYMDGESISKFEEIQPTPAQLGVIELLWNVFGGTINEHGYKVLDPHIGAIYGDSITLERAEQICERLKAKEFASTNIVLGIGSFTYQYNTRDTFGFAMKATYGEITHSGKNQVDKKDYVEAREIFKDPITDDGTKKSKKGLLQVYSQTFLEDSPQEFNKLVCDDQQTWEQEQTGLLQTVFKDSKMVRMQSLDEIREILKSK